MSVITLKGMEFLGHHGCFEEERLIGTMFLVDLSYESDTAHAEKTDDLEMTIDYQEIYNLVQAEMNKPSKLIENLVRRIFEAVSHKYHFILRLSVTVSKINPSLGGKVDKVSITLCTKDVK